MPEQIILSWLIFTFDRRKPRFPLARRTWFLNWDKVSEPGHVVMAVHSSLRLLMNFVVLAVPVIRQDYAYWLGTGKSVMPNRIGLQSILAERTQERGRLDKPKA